MIELGKKQLLEVVRKKEFGVYVAEKAGDEESILLPKKQVPKEIEVGDKLEVFIYKDSGLCTYLLPLIYGLTVPSVTVIKHHNQLGSGAARL